MAFYIDKLKPKFERIGNTSLNVTLNNGDKILKVEPRRLFPNNDRTHYISFIDNDGNEKGILSDIELVEDESKEALINCLEEYYMIPQISEVLDIVDKKGMTKYTCITNKGTITFAIYQRRDTKILPDGRIIFRDIYDNRYEIADYSKLSSKSKKFLENEI